jgi:peroxiredoxin
MLEEKESYSIEGSTGSALLQTLAAEHKKVLEALGEIARKNMENVSSHDYPAMKQRLDQQFDSITSTFQEYSLRFIHENSPSPAILIALYNLYGQGFPVFHPTTDFPVYQFVDSVLMASHSELEAVHLLHAQVTEAKEVMESHQQGQRLNKGEIASDFVSSRPDGSLMALSDLRGNYVLLGFWASWSNLCREENATLVKALELYGDRNFRILQVSVDDNKSAWMLAIDEDGLEWDHVSDLSRWETPVVDLYGVEKIPFNVIIDPAGKIVETDLYGEKLLIKLNQLLNN